MFLTLLVGVVLLTVVVLIVRISSLTLKLQELEYELMKVRQLWDRLSLVERDIIALRVARTTEKAETADVRASEPRLPAVTETPQPKAEVKPELHLTPPPVVPEFVEGPAPRSRTREEWEAFVGGKLLNRIGAIALIIGVGLFLKHAFDQNWISETVRVLIGAVAGLVCLAGAYRTHAKGLKIFAQGLVGSGISILYLSVYASFNFYALVPQWIAFVLMSIVTALALVQAITYDSLAAALLGLIGGFLTPVMLSTGQSDEIGLFTYLVLLNVGILGSLIKKQNWDILEPLSLISTWLLYAAWYTRYYQPEDLFVTVFFITLFWGLFFAIDFLRQLRTRRQPKVLHHFVAAANSVILFGTLHGIIDPQHHDWMGATTALIGGIYAATFLLVEKQSPASSFAKARFLITSIVLFVVAAGIQFSGFTTVIVWCLQAAALIWWGFRWLIRPVWILSLGLVAIAVLKLLITKGALAFDPLQEFTLLVSLRTLTIAVVTITLGFGAFCAGRSAGTENDETLDWIKDTLHFGWCVMLFILVSVETNDWFRLKLGNLPVAAAGQSLRVEDAFLHYTRLMTFPVVWGLCSTVLAWGSIRRGTVTVMIAALGMLSLAGVLSALSGIAFEPVEVFRPILNVRVASMALVAGCLTLQLKMLRSGPEGWSWLPDTRHVVQVSIVIFVLLLLTAEMRDFFEKQISDLQASSGESDVSESLDHIRNLQQLSLSGVWLLYSVAAMAVGIWRSFRIIRIVAFVLFAITILKIFIYDLSFLETTYRITSFIALGLMLLGVSYVYQRYKELIFGSEERL
ncbi:MAG: DUF2339 domain-containing protein [Ignavibacteria bacterium]|nr:DUF2339 domain-containing protein [Ignavibacteria bacterium]